MPDAQAGNRVQLAASSKPETIFFIARNLSLFLCEAGGAHAPPRSANAFARHRISGEHRVLVGRNDAVLLTLASEDITNEPGSGEQVVEASGE